jgi:hypothetical protein
MTFAHHPTETAPDPGWASRRHFPEVKPKAKAVKIDRTIDGRLIMARRTKILADARWAKLHVLPANRAAKTLELETPSPELRN